MEIQPQLGRMVRSKVFQANPNTPSMKGTIPLEVVSGLKLKHGNEIEWEAAVEDGKIIYKVRKAE